MSPNHRWFPARFDVHCVCGAAVPKDSPSIYDGSEGVKKTIRCSKCPDLTGPEKREIERVNATEETKRRNAAENARRAAESPSDIAEYVRLAGANLGLAIPMIRAHEGIASALARRGITVDTLVSALVHMAAADASRAACSTPSWHAVAEQCAAWGLVPTTQADTPVYVFCRDTKTARLTCERTRYGWAQQIALALPHAALQCGWTFGIEALLGDLAARIRAREEGAQARADALRAALEKRSGDTDPDRVALRDGFRAYFDDDRPFPTDSKPALARAGKAAEGVLRDALRAVYAAKPLDDAQREAVIELRMDLDADAGGLPPHEVALLAALKMPMWHMYEWYQASGAAEERQINWAPPSLALWSRPPLNVRRTDSIPSVWWSRLRFVDGDVLREIGFELERDAVYQRAIAGKSVVIDSNGLLVQADPQKAPSPWLTWQGEMGTAKVIREMFKAHPTLQARFLALGIDMTDAHEEVIEGEAPPVVGVEHLRERRRALVDQGAPVDYAAESERLNQRVAVERQPREDG